MGSDKATTFDMVWRAKGICDGATSLDDMANMLEAAASVLRRMSASSVSLSVTVEDDYAYLETADPAVANIFSMSESESE